MPDDTRIVITGIGLTAPNGNNLTEFRANLLAGKSGVSTIDTHYMGEMTAGVCHFDPLTYQKKKELRRGTRAGSIAIYCAHEAVGDAGLDIDSLDKSRIGIYLGITEHGNVETENEIWNIKQYDYDVGVWSHHHNPRTVANSPAGEITLNMGITGPHYTLGAACAAGNIGLIQGAQMLQLDEVDVALAGGVWLQMYHGHGAPVSAAVWRRAPGRLAAYLRRHGGDPRRVHLVFTGSTSAPPGARGCDSPTECEWRLASTGATARILDNGPGVYRLGGRTAEWTREYRAYFSGARG